MDKSPNTYATYPRNVIHYYLQKWRHPDPRLPRWKHSESYHRRLHPKLSFSGWVYGAIFICIIVPLMWLALHSDKSFHTNSDLGSHKSGITSKSASRSQDAYVTMYCTTGKQLLEDVYFNSTRRLIY